MKININLVTCYALLELARDDLHCMHAWKRCLGKHRVSCMNHCNSFSQYRGSPAERNNQKRPISPFSNLPMWCFSDTLQQRLLLMKILENDRYDSYRLTTTCKVDFLPFCTHLMRRPFLGGGGGGGIPYYCIP